MRFGLQEEGADTLCTMAKKYNCAAKCKKDELLERCLRHAKEQFEDARAAQAYEAGGGEGTAGRKLSGKAIACGVAGDGVAAVGPSPDDSP